MTAAVDRVFLARHGRTALNAQGRLRGLSDPPLDEVGIVEAARLADALVPKHPTAVICSPLQRAVATAHAIGAACGATVTVEHSSSWWPTMVPDRWSWCPTMRSTARCLDSLTPRSAMCVSEPRAGTSSAWSTVRGGRTPTTRSRTNRFGRRGDPGR
ncbi:histidine phosphatase family protein [Candidatus Mycobacterium methanotrophicum]|uniref:Histidine phosphatase family protein n=1 Tax=Candidatus Mycobacterium methanotrophicum TaxID=2943498 RepID=A0ABY4QFJ0_9MYCO|nr:histidine phosphatase family protein [Candidatus Mycobacterium methanotrophicum]UQX09747.1 histidine phosphatase family protein [Candidatus Mycobacterium methanotrophicum]